MNKKRSVGLLLVGVLICGTGMSSAATTKRKPKKNATPTTKVKPATSTIRTLNMCDLMSGITFGDLFPDKTVGFIHFGAETETWVDGGWKKSDLAFESKLDYTNCEFDVRPVARPENTDDRLSIGQRKVRGASFTTFVKSGTIPLEPASVPGVEGTVWEQRGKMENRDDAALTVGRGCAVFYEAKNGTFSVVHQLFRTKMTAADATCDVAYEALRRTLARVASGTVAVLPG
jgi:hypothetical protein